MVAEFTTTFRLPSGKIANSDLSAEANIDPLKMAQRTLQEQAIDLRSLYVHDSASATLLPSTSSSADLGYYPGTFGTDAPAVKTYDVKTVGATTLYGRFRAVLPDNYEAGETVSLRAHVDMSAVADTSCTVDFSAYLSNENAGIGSDLVTTSATSCNSVAEADYDFDLTSTGLNPGDELDCRIAIAVNDAAGASAVVVTVGKISLLCDTRG